ncbi:hypothetical protein [Nonomuraea sp. NPDC048901]|uniref:hypothetical protein n=1 Tax=Nonomuraea sp. NPDC048901 TaxID=3155627 RepID=UPI0033E44696
MTPEAVALTELLTDLGWRRHVAMVDERALRSFYERVAQQMNELASASKGPAPPSLWGQQDGLTRWVEQLRRKHRIRRRRHLAEQRHTWQPLPLPENGHFK